ncbi:MAG: bifunctional 2-C-methyl-D-erythritol 4-phosphate cytidylyltransferase/2-C-methyl-D-erythritol 2,4-cyclodiphosphate synthase [Desulfobulbaceae bacterium]
MSETDTKRVAAIIPAAGSGTRLGASVPKQFLPLAKIPILIHTVRRLLAVGLLDYLVIVLPAPLRQEAERMLREHLADSEIRRLVLVDGGATRQESVQAGLENLFPETELVVVHDGARPLVRPELVEACLRAAEAHGAAAAAVPVRDTIKRVRQGRITETVDRGGLWHAQTPQAARVELLRRAMREALRTGFTGTDEASLLEHADIPVVVVEGNEDNIKITRPDDMVLAANIGKELNMLRIGHGFDAHRFKIGRHLILGGVDIPFDLGLEGHSDADVVVHALIDALLGASGGGDIGRLFPDSDPQYKNISSLKLLEEVVRMVQEKSFSIVNTDITVICQRPKLAPYLDEMRDNLAAVCFLDRERVNVKATTTEMMGFTGRGEGISVHAVALLQEE